MQNANDSPMMGAPSEQPNINPALASQKEILNHHRGKFLNHISTLRHDPKSQLV